MGLHSMAIIGYRVDQFSNKYYLLQNWWHTKQFLEVDEKYLCSCSPSFVFVKTPQTFIPSNFPQGVFRYYELEGIDKPETYPTEVIHGCSE